MLLNIKWFNAIFLIVSLNSLTFASEYDKDYKINKLVDDFVIYLLEKDEKEIIENF